MRRRVLLFSGGLDSFLVWALAGEPDCIFFRTGTRGNGREWERVRWFIDRFGMNVNVTTVLRLERWERADGFVPYRNLLFIIHASMMAPVTDILIGQVMEWQVDKNPAFYRWAERAARDLAGKRLNISAPFAGVPRSELVRRYLGLGKPPEALRLTRSCQSASAMPCGRCSNCINRWVALTNNGIHEPLEHTPTEDEWWSNARAQRGLFRAAHLPMYVQRWQEARRAFARARRG